MASLQDALLKSFNIPLFHRAASDQGSLVYPKLRIAGAIKYLAEDQKAAFHVYDYSISNPNQRTRRADIQELQSHFELPGTNKTALNFLDIENRTGITFCPLALSMANIMRRLDNLKEHDKGNIGVNWIPRIEKEFFVLSNKHSISTIHVDTGGTLTWVLILEGRKIWYYPSRTTSQTVRWLGLAGSQAPENYEDGWVKLELQAGDLL